MNNISQESAGKVESFATKKGSNMKKIIIVIVAIGLAALGTLFYLDYVQTKSTVTEQEKSLNGIKENNSKLQKRLDTIETRLGVPEVNAPDPATYSLTLNEVVSQPSNQYVANGQNFVFVSVDLKNTSNKEVYVAKGGMKLKDENGKEYSIHLGYPTNAYPNKLKPLEDASVGAGEVTTGTVVFLVPSDAKKFTLLYDTASLPLLVE